MKHAVLFFHFTTVAKFRTEKYRKIFFFVDSEKNLSNSRKTRTGTLKKKKKKNRKQTTKTRDTRFWGGSFFFFWNPTFYTCSTFMITGFHVL